MTEEIKFCKECKFKGSTEMFCVHPNNGLDLTNGTAKVRFSDLNRKGKYFLLDSCGEDGKWWEPKLIAPTYWQKLKTYFN